WRLVPQFVRHTSPTSAQNAAQRSAGATFDVQSAADDTGLPMLVVRAPFNLVWSGYSRAGLHRLQRPLRALRGLLAYLPVAAQRPYLRRSA
ncbi:outer membrane protein assembly factor BamC, partial [Klebsiella pneumoniae]|nr:outer membrane protein assembly factor BamC [Klebsiella pneumoniae]